jgi:hypothetical protein
MLFLGGSRKATNPKLFSSIPFLSLAPRLSVAFHKKPGYIVCVGKTKRRTETPDKNNFPLASKTKLR